MTFCVQVCSVCVATANVKRFLAKMRYGKHSITMQDGDDTVRTCTMGFVKGLLVSDVYCIFEVVS